LGFSGRIAALFLQARITPLLAIIALLAGLFALAITPREEEPQINVTMADVIVPFPGASVRDVETIVAIPGEQVLSRIAGVEHVYSVSRPGLAIITVQFKVGVAHTEAVVRLQDTIQSNRDFIVPEAGVGEPIVKPRGIDDVPIVALTLWSEDPALTAYSLERVAHALEVELKSVPGTRDIATLGGPGRTVRVLLDVEKLNAYRLSVSEVRQALAAANASGPAGQVVARGAAIQVQAGTFLQSAKDVSDLAIGTFDGRPVYVSDVASVSDGPDQPTRYVWHGSGKASGSAAAEHPAVTLAITKKPGENAVAVAQQLMDRVEALRNTVIPAAVKVTVTRNYGETADDKSKKLIQKLLFATFAVVVLVFVTMGRREAVIVGAAIIITLAATLFASWAWGFTLNRVSLFALIFSIGILVDDAIVVVENIHRHRALEPGRPLLDVIPQAVDEVGGPTILATFTVIAALLPMAFVSGLMGPYMSPIPINASLGMLISLAVAFVVTPWLALKLTSKSHGAHAGETKFEQKLRGAFTRLLSPFLDPDRGSRARRRLWFGIGVAMLISVALPALQWVVLKMLPFDNKSEFQVVVDMPAGTPLEETASALRDMGAYLSTIEEVENFQAYAGTSAPINFNGLVRQYYLRQLPEMGDLQVNLVDKHKRSRKSHAIAAAARPELERIAASHGANVKIVEVPPGPPVLSPIVAEIYGPDEAGRIEAARFVRSALTKTADVVGVDDSIEESAPRLVLKVDQRKAAQFGIDARTVVDSIQALLTGVNVTVIHDEQSKYPVPIRLLLPPAQRGDLRAVLRTSVKSRDGSSVPIGEIVTVLESQREQTRYHKDLLPVSYVIGDMSGKLDSPLYGMFSARSAVFDKPLPDGSMLKERFISQPTDHYRSYALKWDGEWQVTYETFRDMGIAYAVGLVLIYLLVVAQFGSYVTPLIIMAPIPLTIIGVMPGHALLGAQFTATSMIGMIALAGIIVRNSILLVDFINLQVEEGAPFAQAVINSAATRAKPIALTALAAMLGAVFILDDPIFNGLAISLIFGIMVSTLLTLVVIPVLFFAINRRRHTATDRTQENQ
jgi:multidrug efflux pump subunit AcrB